MTDIIEKISGLAQSAAVKLHVRSALNPMLWLCGIGTPLCFIFAYLFRDIPELRILLVIFGVVPISVTALGFIGFALFRPEKLQSEDYQIRHESLQIIQGKSKRIEIPPTSIEAIANPYTKQLPFKEDDDA